jgi:hypothetical protein
MRDLNKAQLKCVRELEKGFETNQRQVLAWYTGAGKTNIFLALAARILKKNPKAKVGISAYWHRNVKEQVYERAEGFLPRRSYQMLSGGDYDRGRGVFIFNPQWFVHNKADMKFDYLIIDEAHIGTVKRHRSLLTNIVKENCKSDCKILGSSFTAWDLIRSDIFTGAGLLRRGMEEGLSEDGRVQDFNINVRRMDISPIEEAFNRKGDLKKGYINSNFSTLQSVVINEVLKTVKREGDKLGGKCLVIVPPGNACAIARATAYALGEDISRVYIGAIRTRADDSKGHEQDKQIMQKQEENLREFREDPKVRFLVVVNKCQLGFDMPELTSTIDATMSRNVSLLIQRWGRLARRHPSTDKPKEYFYLFDQRISHTLVEWLIMSCIELSQARWSYGQHYTRSLEKRSVQIRQLYTGQDDFKVGFKQLLAIAEDIKLHGGYEVEFSGALRSAADWNVEALEAVARQFKDRTEFAAKDRVAYNKMRELFTDKLNEIFPPRRVWTEAKVIAAMKQCKTRTEFKDTYNGAYEYLRVKNKLYLLDDLLPVQWEKKWTKESALAKARQCRNRHELRQRFCGAYELLMRQYREELNQIFSGAHVGRARKMKKGA